MNRRLHHALVSAGCVGLVVGASPAASRAAAHADDRGEGVEQVCPPFPDPPGCLPDEPPPTVATVPPVVATGLPPVPYRFESGPAPQAPSGVDPNGTTGGRP